MGQENSIVYSVEVPGQEQPANQTKVRRNPQFVNGLHDSPPGTTNKSMREIFQHSFKTFPSNPCLGTIETNMVIEQGKEVAHKSIKYITYKDLQKVVGQVASAATELGIAPEVEDVPGLKMKFLGVYSKNRAEWMYVDLACIMYGFVLVPIYDTLGPENISYVLNHSQVQNMFCSKAAAETLMKTQDLGKLRTIICFDPLPEELIAKIKERGVQYYDFNDFTKKGTKPLEYASPKPKDCLTFSYTSGTTGPPKGAMLSHMNFASFCSIISLNKDFNLDHTEVYLSYLPLPHVLERMCVFAMIYLGARIVFYSGEVQKLKDDIDLVKPSFFCSVPRLYSRFYDAVKSKLEKTEGVAKMLVDRGLETKLYNVKTSGSYEHKIYDALVFNKTKQAFGGNMKMMISGSAPLLPNVHSFMKVVACCPLIEGYGQTESTGASFVSTSLDPMCGHIGGPTSNIEYKLVDIPEMNYTHNDKDEQGRPCPRGEICMRGPGVFLGYYKDPEKTKEAIDEQGWLHSGDVGAILPETFALKLIDRKKNIFKLQQGEYVAAEKVQAAYLKRNDLQEMFLYGDSNQCYAIAVGVPNKHIIEQIAKAKNIEGDFPTLCKSKEVRTELLTRLNAFTKKQGLSGFEQAKNIYLDPESFALKGIVTNTMKLQRHEAKKVYKKELEDLYKEGMLGGGGGDK